jgi:hypothetical protein
MLSKEFIGTVSTLLTLVGYLPYILSTVKGRTKPHVFSWIIWGTIATIVFFAQTSDDAGPGAWAMGFSAAGCFIIAALAVRFGEKKITRSDWLSFVGALMAIPIWCLTRNPLWAVLLVTAIDACGYYPTFRKSWHHPREENVIVYIVDSMKFVLALLALEHYSTVTVLSPLFIALVEAALTVMILWRRLVRR